MKKILSVQQNANSADLAILVARIGIALLMLTHGLPKMAMLFSGEPIQFMPLFGMSAEFALAMAVFAEVFCSLLLLVGLGTRLATIPLIITMAVAVFMVHAADPFARQEPALQYLLVYVVLLIAGSGKYSLDYLWQKKNIVANSNVQGKERPLSFQS